MGIIETKQSKAQENIDLFNRLGISLRGKKVLDIGFGLGYNSNIFREAGADVYGVEPDKKAFDFAISNHLIDPDKAFNTRLQELPSELMGTFDLATILLYNIPFSEGETVMHLLSQSIKPSGTTIIELADDIYIHGDPYLESIPSITSRYFHSVNKFPLFYFNILTSMFIIAREPRLLYKYNPQAMTPLEQREAELSSLEAEEKTISEAEALLNKQHGKEGQDIGEE